MKVFLVVFLLVKYSLSEEIQNFDYTRVEEISCYNYHEKFGIKEAARIKRIEESGDLTTRIIGGSNAALGNFPYLAGLVIALTTGQTSVCGASLISNTKLVTAAHCWFDGNIQARQFTVVLGSILLFTGGTRVVTTKVEMHSGWSTTSLINDIALITIPRVNYNNNIRNIALPVKLTSQNFAGYKAVASGFGKTSDASGISSSASLKQIWLTVITNAVCQNSYGSVVSANNICTSGVGNIGTCTGDSGGPLAVDSNNQKVLIGITSFGAGRCQSGQPSVFTRVTSFISWIQSRL